MKNLNNRPLHSSAATHAQSPASMMASASAGIRRSIRTLRDAVRQQADAALAPRRRKQAQRIARSTVPVRSVMVMCYGNICRSPYFAAALKHSMPRLRITSSGLVGPDRPVPQESLQVAASRGIDLSEHRSQLISRELLMTAQLVVVMDPHQARIVARRFGYPRGKIVVAGDLDPLAGEGRTIADPWRQSIGAFETCFDRIDRCVAALVDVLEPSGQVVDTTSVVKA